jgi:ubiquinone/menaquinone biosynthesis C-methylase UbiE
MPEIHDEELKEDVRRHWEHETCGTRYGGSGDRLAWFREIDAARTALEPFIPAFAGFREAQGKRVLEIGVGAGSDFLRWCRSAQHATGVDLTEAAIALTRERLELEGIFRDRYDLRVADAEALPFADATFDLVYSWGVLHHSPRTEVAFRELFRVLKPGGIIRAMVYHVPSWTGFMLYLLYGAAKGRFGLGQKDAIYRHLESPGTKAYTLNEGRELALCAGFEAVGVSTRLGPGDMLLIKPGRRYDTAMGRLIFALYPRFVVRALGDRLGLYLLIEGRKPHASTSVGCT